MAITTDIKLISPELAMQWLEESNLHNRPVRQSTVMKYARDMATGRWHLTHQGICFTEDGILIDGQHRLWAIVESNHAVKMMVVRGMSMESQESLDAGVNRSTGDVISLRDDKKIPSQAIGVARWLALQQLGTRNPSRAEQVKAYDVFRDRIHSALGMFQNVRGIRVVPVLAVFTRALYHVKPETLVPAANVLCDGMQARPIDRVIILLRNAILVSRPMPWDVYWKTERALKAYLSNDPIKNLVATDYEYFPLPGEKKAPPRKATTNLELKKKKRASASGDSSHAAA